MKVRRIGTIVVTLGLASTIGACGGGSHGKLAAVAHPKPSNSSSMVPCVNSAELCPADDPTDHSEPIAPPKTDEPTPAAPTTLAAPTRVATHSVTPKPTPTTAPTTHVVVKPKPKPTMALKRTVTASQQQAINAAESYLDLDSGFSRAGLIAQLTSQYGSGFSTADATYAADHITVNWNDQAVLAAKSYLKLGSGFSRSSLISQLTSAYGSQFTLAQATYAADQVGLK